MKQIVFVSLLCCLFFSNALAQKSDFTQLEKRIVYLNDQMEYEQAITELNQYLEDVSDSPEQKVKTYILKSQTYKRLFNYEQVLHTLSIAKKNAALSSNPKPLIAMLQAEEAFALFDTHKYAESKVIMDQLSLNNYRYIPEISRIFLIMQDGFLDFLNGAYVQSEKKLDQSLLLARKHSPRDVPNILAKHMELYAKTGQWKKMDQAFEEGLANAQRHHIVKYELYLYEIRKKIALESKDYVHFPIFQKQYDSLAILYNTAENTGKIHLLEQKLERQKTELNKKYEKAFQTFLVVIISLLVALALTLFKYNIVNKAKRELAESENQRIHDELARLTSTKNENKLNLSDYDLSERQLKIIHYLREGKTNKEIGNLLFVSENTVKYHLKAIYEILNIAHRSELK